VLKKLPTTEKYFFFLIDHELICKTFVYNFSAKKVSDEDFNIGAEKVRF